MDNSKRWILIKDFAFSKVGTSIIIILLFGCFFSTILFVGFLDNRAIYKEIGVEKIVYAELANAQERELMNEIKEQVRLALVDNEGKSLSYFLDQMNNPIENPEFKEKASKAYLVAYRDNRIDNFAYVNKDNAGREQRTFFIYYATRFQGEYTYYPIFKFIVDYRYSEERDRYEYKILRVDVDGSAYNTGVAYQHDGFVEFFTKPDQ